MGHKLVYRTSPGNVDLAFNNSQTQLYYPVQASDASLVVWGKWERDFDKLQPITFNREMDNEEAKENSLKKVSQIAFGKQFKLVLYEDGELYSWGICKKGCLGLGKSKIRTSENNHLERIPIREKVVEIAVGTNHVLARTVSGAVYAWGNNNKGQVTEINYGSSNRRSSVRKSK